MKQIILPIHPEYVKKILSGEKSFEFRKRIPQDIDYILIYETSPISRIVAIGEVAEILKEKKNVLWERTSYSSGINKSFFDLYFENKDEAYAIRLKNIYKLRNNLDLSFFHLCKAPQSYVILENFNINSLLKKSDKIIVENSFIFIGGIHGVGKSTFCQNIIAPFGYSSISASSLIKMGNGIVQNSKTINENSIASNQNILCIGAEEFLKNNYKTAIDGHFCLVKADGNFQKIEIEVFERMNPSFLILVETSEAQIRKNIESRSEMKLNYSLSDFLKIENEYAHEISAKLGIPLYIFNSFDNSLENKEKFQNILSGDIK